MPIVAVANQKGGVGKTTTTLNLGAALQEAGKRVLLVDLDPQANLTVAAGLPAVDELHPSVGDLLMSAARHQHGGVPLTADQAVVETPCGLPLIPSNGVLSAAELSLVSALNREAALAGVLAPIVDEYDYVLIDCLPSLGLLGINGLRAADGVIIPVQADFLAMQGLAQIFETVAAVRTQLRPSLSIYGVFLTMVDHRTSHSRDVVRIVRESLSGQVPVFETEVRLHVVLKETARAGRSILAHDGASPAAQAYRGLARELMATLGDAPSKPVREVSTRSRRAAAARPARADAPVATLTDEEFTPAPADRPEETPAPLLTLHDFRGRQPVRAGARNGAHDTELLDDMPSFESFLEGREQWLGSSAR